MSSARKDYEGFLKWLHLPENEVPSNVRRLANLILINFDKVLATSRNRSQRSTLLAKITQRDLLQTPDLLPEITSIETDVTWAWKRLHSLTIGPFRGFRRPETFDLQKRIVLFYGPNGSGKTSLCEALEYALLGYVEEAGAKRIAADNYLSNIHEKRFVPPILKATDEVIIKANADAYQFCFVEKNRIDAFARIAAKSPAQRAELIATLFGMENFNEFVDNFNESIDSQLKIATPKKTLLETKREALKQDQKTVDDEAVSLKVLDTEELNLALAYSDNMTYEKLKNTIGNDETPARLKELNDILDTIPPKVLNVTKEGVQELYNEADKAQEDLNTLSDNLKKRTNQISFKDLYTAIIALQPFEGDHCPACDTPLNGPNHVLCNPYEKATAGLGKLSELAELQDKQTKATTKADQASRDLKAKLEVLREFVIASTEHETLTSNYLATLPETITASWWTTIYEENDNHKQELPTLKDILDVAQRIEEQDKASKLLIEERQRNITERDKLNKYQLSIQTQDSKRKTFIDSVNTAKRRIEAFDEENSKLIQEVAQETIDNKRDIPIKEAYDHFRQCLRSYRSQLPGTLIAGLNDLAMMLYNGFNGKDLNADKLVALHLPLTASQKIEISFRGNPHDKVDALKILSEGHIRCLGLSILLAKSLSLKSPLIVFDDAINAIDHDHRRGIRETIFENDLFENTQIMVTCHSHEFIKDIQQNLAKPMRDDCKVYLIKNHDGDYHPKIKRNVASRNYIEMARTSREELNDRGALDASRKAIEMLSEKLWRWLDSHGHGILSLKLAGMGAEPILRNLCEALCAKIKKANTFSHDHKSTIIAALDRILGIPEQNLVWTYLNKGTHEEADRDDFDGDKVEAIVVTLEELESLDLRPGH